MKGFVCPHCKGSIQIPRYKDRLAVALQMVEEGMSLTEAEKLCGLGASTLSKRFAKQNQKSPLELHVVDWQNGKAKKAIG